MNEMALMAVDRVEEAKMIYESEPDHLTIKIADRELAIWLIDSKLLCVEAKSSEAVMLMEKFSILLRNSQQYSHVPNKHLIILAIKVIEENPGLLDHPDLVFHF
jgi:hypothetical protein